MRTQRAWSLLAFGLLAAACATAGKPPVEHGTSEPAPEPAGDEPNAFPAEPTEQSAPEAQAPSDSERDEGNFEDPAPAPAPSAPAAAATEGARGEASADRAPAKHASRSAGAAAEKPGRTFDVERERPGLGTSWGETRSSHVSDVAFERASTSPFALTTIHYNDQTGVTAMLHGGSPLAFRTDSATTVAGGALTVRLVDAAGAPLPTFSTAAGELAQGEVGQRYMIELVNQTANRFEAVVTVDGLDVIDGRSGSLAKRGYLVQPFATLDIDGFRQNMDQVAAFRFGSVRGSYAASKGSDRNVGVIGVAVFAERGAAPIWTRREVERRETADPFPARFATPPRAR